LNILAIDQGTSATKAVLVGPGQEVLGAAAVPVGVRAVGADGVEADPEELYASVIRAGSQALAAARAPAHAVALANQGETVLAWDRRTGRPLTPAIVWQDGRSASVCARLAGSAGRLAAITGLRLDPYFAAPKMTWLRENLTAGGVVTTTDTWLLARLGAGYVTDAATASRTLLLDLDSTQWSAEACAIFGLDPGELPVVADCAGITGETTAFGPALPVAGLAVDQQAALLAERCFAAGQAKCTYGTGAFLLATTGPGTGSPHDGGAHAGNPHAGSRRAVRSAGGLAASVAWRLAGQPTYCLDGQVYTAGAAVRWLGEVGLLGDASELDVVGGSVPDSGGVTFLPSLAGLGAPHWRPDARGAFTGLGLASTRAHLIRAVIDGLAASVALLAGSVAADLGAPLTALRADGGLTRSRLLLQSQADLLQLPVEVCRTPDATALGVAALARLGMGEAASLDEAVGPADVESVVQPQISATQAAERLAAFDTVLRALLAAPG
jgi:glycerol kinase